MALDLEETFPKQINKLELEKVTILEWLESCYNRWNRRLSGTDQLPIRFECEGDTNQDRVFIDDVKVEGK